MQRRNFLQLLSTLPFLGWLAPKPTEYRIGVDLGSGESRQVTMHLTSVGSSPATITTYVFDESGGWRELFADAIPAEEIHFGLAPDSDVISFKDVENAT